MAGWCNGNITDLYSVASGSSPDPAPIKIYGGDFVKKVLSFALAVALAFSLLLGSAFASSGVTVVAPDTFISWGSAGDLTSLAVPSDAVSDGYKYIVYQVRDWVVSYFRVRFVIDRFSRGDPVEGETLLDTIYRRMGFGCK